MHKHASLLDYSYPGLAQDIWQADGTLLPYHKDYILKLLTAFYKTYKFKEPLKWVKDITNIGSLTTNKYLRTSDFDCHIVVSIEDFRKTNMPEASDEEAALYLDNARKEWDRAKILLPFGEHPLELYFESELSPSNVKAVGRYSLITNSWLKEPIFFAQDDDYEESKRGVIEEAVKLANELDSSFGNIRRDIQRIDELKQVAQAWPVNTRQLYMDKIQGKLDSIEDEIEKAVALQQALIDERHERQDPFSENEIKFKYLARFFYFYVISELKDLLKKTDGEVTETELPLIKKIVTEAGQVLRFTNVDGMEFRIFKDPSPDQAEKLWNTSDYHQLRYIMDDSGIYMWDAYYAEHQDVAMELGLDAITINKLGYITTAKEARKWGTEFAPRTAAKADPEQTETDICVDFDHTIAQGAKFPAIGEPIAGAKEALAKLKELGYTVIIYSCRGSSQEGIDGVRDWMDSHEMPYDSIFEGEKPFAKFYIDDRAIRFEDWGSALKQVEKSIKTASLHITAYTPQRLWIDPMGKEYPVDTAHADWILENSAMLSKVYGWRNTKKWKFEDGGEIYDFEGLDNTLLAAGWSRVGDIYGGNGYGIQIADLRHVPDYLIDKLMGKKGVVTFEDINGQWVTVDVDAFITQGQKAINQVLTRSKVHASLSVVSFERTHPAFWIDPNGVRYSVNTTHEDWLFENEKMLRDKYGYDKDSIGQSWWDIRTINLLRQMLQDGWVRIGDLFGSGRKFLGNGVEVEDLTHVPNSVFEYASNFGPGAYLMIEDLQHRWVELEVSALLEGGQEAVDYALKQQNAANRAVAAALVLPTIDPKTFNRKEPYALFIGTSNYGKAGKFDMFNVYGQHPMITEHNQLPTVGLDTLIKENIPVIGKEPRAGDKQPAQDISSLFKQALLKEAGYAHAYWLDPNGKVFQVRGEDEDAARRDLDRSDENTHSGWAFRHLDMLQKDYGIDPKSLTGTRSLVELGWTRIGDAYGTDWGIDVSNTDNIPSFIDDFIAQFAPEGSMITVAGSGGARYQHNQSGYTFEWPVKSIQQTVQQLKNRQSRVQAPQLQVAPANQMALSKRDVKSVFNPYQDESLKQGPAHAVFEHIQKGLPEFGLPDIEMYTILGDSALFGSTVAKDKIEELGIPIDQKKQAQTKKVKQGEYGAVMALIPHPVAQEIVEWGVRNIPDEDVYDNPDKPRLGRELESHITIKYGLMTEDAKSVRQFFNSSKPFKAKLGKVKHFQPPEMDFDVVTVEIISEDLDRINAEITEKFECAEGLPSDIYHPHITVSYVKRDTGKNYIGSTEFDDMDVDLDTIIFSPAKGNRTYFSVSQDKEGAFHIEKIIKNAYPGNWGQSAWISPAGEIFEFDDNSHEDEIFDLMDDPKLYNQEDVLTYAIDKGWVRFGEMGGGLETGLNLKNLRRIPTSVFTYLTKFTGQKKQIVVADNSGAYVHMPVDEFVLGQNAVNKVMQQKRMQSSLSKTAGSDTGYWVDPKGSVYDCHSEGLIHNEWICANLELLKNEYGLNIPEGLAEQSLEYFKAIQSGEENVDQPFADSVWREMIQSGWVRVGDSDSGEVGVELNSLRAIPPYMDSLLAQDLEDGDYIRVEGISDHTSVSIEYPFKNLQQSVNKALSSPTKTAEFLPSFVQAPDNDWQFAGGGDDKEIPVDPDAQSDEQTNMAPCTTGKPRKDQMWRELWHMIKTPFSKKEVESAADVEQEDIEKNELGEDETLLEYSKGFKDLNRFNTNKPKTTWDAGPSKAPNQQEPYSPLPVTLDVVTNPDNENWRYPWRFTRRPIGDQSNQGEVTQALEHMLQNLASLQKKAEMLEMSIGQGPNFSVLVNPTGTEARGLFEKSQERQLRYTYDQDGTCYLWDAYYGTHFDVKKELHELGFPITEEAPDEFVMGERDLSVFGSLDKKAYGQSNSVPDYLMDEWKTDQIHDDTDSEPYVNHDQRDYPGGTHDSPENTDSNIGWAKDNQPYVVRLDQIEKPFDRKWAPGLPDYQVYFFDTMPMSDGSEI